MIIPTHHRRNGFALVLTLGFVVLLTFVVVAFFSNSIFERRISNGSANQSKVEVFARGALDTTVGDLRQEIVDGSTAESVVATGTPFKVYLPNYAVSGAASSMTPAYQISSNYTPTFNSGVQADGLANVLKVSTYGVPFYAKTQNYSTAGVARAANVSTTTTAQGGHAVSLARWNMPLLMAVKSETDPTPNATGYKAPDWVLVANDGTNPTAVSNNVVGRYAYTIYNEGGLLDMNVAGYPTATDMAPASHKMSTALADLTQTGLTPSQINAILGWRNYATAQPTGQFPSYGFTSANGLNYFNATFSNTTGFLSPGNTSLNVGVSDQRFVSRQHLLNFLLQGVSSGLTGPALQTLQNSLQCLGTFSRTVDQPSYRPDPMRPKVVNYYTAAAAGVFSAPGAGGNSAFGLDDHINPNFLEVPVTTTFTRYDGTAAVVGEPLVKTRFALNRLAWLTYKGPSADLYVTSPADPVIAKMLSQGISVQTIKNGTIDNIKAYFGLTWNGGYWLYDVHNGGSTGSGPIMRVGRPASVTTSDANTYVQDAKREPDFFELLKASVTVGAIAKSSASNHSGGGSPPTVLDVAQYNLDTSPDYQLIQIGANIIDQFDNDSYPTHIQFTTPGLTKDFYGDENIPSLYRVHTIGLNIEQIQTGTGVMMMLPEVWNPHAPNSNAATVGPTNFRFFAETPTGYTAPAVRPLCRAYPNTTTTPAYNGYSVSTSKVPLDQQTSSSSPAALGYTELDFSVPLVNATNDYYEPFFLGGVKDRNGTTVGTASKGFAANTNKMSLYGSYAGIKDSVSQLTYSGFVVGDFPLEFVSDTSTSSDTPTPPAMPPKTHYPLPVPPNISQNPSSVDQCNLTAGAEAYLALQYQDASKAWVQYQHNATVLPSYAQADALRGSAGSILRIDITGSTPSSSGGSIDSGAWLTWMDPRTSRFGSFTQFYERIVNPITVKASGYYGVSNQPGTDFGNSSVYAVPGTALKSTWTDSTASPSVGWYPGSWTIDNAHATGTALFVPGYYAQNVIGPQYAPQSNANFYADADGVVRRAMGGYAGAAPGSTTGLPHASLSSTTQSRPFLLNRPFRSVAELSYTFSGTPWKNIDFAFPESGFSALLDVFCINDTPDPKALKAGQIDLNTRQLPVLQALLSGTNGQGYAYKDETTAGGAGATSSLSSAEASAVARALIARTTATATGQGALANVGELVGRYSSKTTTGSGTTPFNIDGTQSYTGFSADLSTAFSDPSTLKVQRLRESAIRALADGGQTRTWNLLIDLVAQTGRYPTGGASLSNFLVDGEQRYWLHVAIDRYTGKIVDQQLERVKE